MRIAAYFNEAYAPREVPLLARLENTRALLQRLDLVELHDAQAIAPQLLEGLHHEAYLRAFLEGHAPLASRQGIAWTPRVRDASLAMLGGQLQAARHALDAGIAMNIARGFHHAHPAAGAGFCALNGLALIAQVMPERRIMVIDCDEHGGNGTEEFAASLSNLYAVSIFGTRFGCRGGTRSWACHVTREQGFAAYRHALDDATALVDAHQPDLLVYQAGVDCHQDDPKSQLKLTTRELFERDFRVFRMARQRRIPVLFVVAGGYQEAERVARLNANTVRAALAAWREHALLSVPRRPGRHESGPPSGL